MFQRLKSRLRDMVTLKALCEAAEQHARQSGEEKPGAEHFLLSALELQDGTAQRAFERSGVDPNGLRKAIAAQYDAALRSIGVDPATLQARDNDPDVVPPTRKIYDAQPSGQAVMQALAARKQEDEDKPLLGAHVVAVIAEMKLGVAARALRIMGIDPDALAAAASTEIKSFRA
jgi:ATP-dependent Clp protease ATP-binding subunit ClpA